MEGQKDGKYQREKKETKVQDLAFVIDMGQK